MVTLVISVECMQAKKAMSEVNDYHVSAGVEVPWSLYMDCGCCSGRVGSLR